MKTKHPSRPDWTRKARKLMDACLKRYEADTLGYTQANIMRRRFRSRKPFDIDQKDK